MSIKLFGSYTSPFVRHCRIAFMETGVDYVFVPTDYTDSAIASPTKRVPYLHDTANDTKLHDSMAILHYLREKTNQSFLTDAFQVEQFALANTVCDTTINLFLLENSGISHGENVYLQRQQARVSSGLRALEAMVTLPKKPDKVNDADYRVACVLDWGLYRRRFTVDDLPNLTAFLEVMNDNQAFKNTAPPQ